MSLRRPDPLTETVPTHRPMPAEDAVIEALDPEARRAVAARWAERADNELATSTTFAELYRGLVILDAGPSLLSAVVRSIEDELRHHLICRNVAERYGGTAVRAPRSRPTEAPRFSGCSERESRILHTILHLCLNEGVAAAYLGACLEAAIGPLAREAVRDILRDEIVHARLGWTFASTLSPRDRTLVSVALPQLLSQIESGWRTPSASKEEPPDGHGIIGLSAICRVFGETVRDLVLPGFEHIGIGTAGARQWLADADRWK